MAVRLVEMKNEKQKKLTQDYADFLKEYEEAKSQGISASN